MKFSLYWLVQFIVIWKTKFELNVILGVGYSLSVFG